MGKKAGYIACDLDKTLAHYESGDFEKYGPLHIGAPIPKMVERIQKHLEEGYEVKIFTARLAFAEGLTDQFKIERAIEEWTEKHVGVALRPTNVKDGDMVLLYDDRAVQVVPNTGRIVE